MHPQFHHFAQVFPKKRLELKSLSERQTKAEEKGPPWPFTRKYIHRLKYLGLFGPNQNRYFCLFFRANLTILGVLVGLWLFYFIYELRKVPNFYPMQLHACPAVISVYWYVAIVCFTDNLIPNVHAAVQYSWCALNWVHRVWIRSNSLYTTLEILVRATHYSSTRVLRRRYVFLTARHLLKGGAPLWT